MTARYPFPAPLLLLWSLVLPLPAQVDASAKKDPDPEVAKKLEEFDDAIDDRKFTRDQEAIQIIDHLLQRWESLHPKDQDSFVKALGDVFKARKRPPEEIGLYRAAAAALGRVGASGAKTASRILVSAYGKKPFDDREYVNLQEDVLENVGVTKDEKQTKFLVDTATRDPEDRIKAAAGKALRHYAGIDQKERKDIFKKLLRNYAKIEGGAKANLDPGDPVVETHRRTLRAIADPWNTTLAALTGENLRTAEEWQHWWNKNKGADWDKK